MAVSGLTEKEVAARLRRRARGGATGARIVTASAPDASVAPGIAERAVSGVSSADQFDPAVIVAVARVRMMQMTVDEVVDVIAVRHRLVTAAGAVRMGGIVGAAGVAGRACGRVRGTNCDRVLVVMAVVRGMQVPVVQVVDVTVMAQGGVAAARPVNVVVIRVRVVRHGAPFVMLELSRKTYSTKCLAYEPTAQFGIPCGHRTGTPVRPMCGPT